MNWVLSPGAIEKEEVATMVDCGGRALIKQNEF